jgi:hypothetical protein
MKIDKRLNIVLTVVRGDGSEVHVHSMPILQEVYEANFLLLSKTISQMYAEGLPLGTCSRVAMLMLRRVADEMDNRSPGAPAIYRPAVDNNLLPEIWRLTNVLVPGETGGWQTVPFPHAVANKLLGDDDIAEVQNYLVFFTAASWVHRRVELEAPNGLYSMWRGSGAQLVSSTPTEFANSLPTSKPAENTGASPEPA